MLHAFGRVVSPRFLLPTYLQVLRECLFAVENPGFHFLQESEAAYIEKSPFAHRLLRAVF